METGSKAIKALAKEASLLPQEELLQVLASQDDLTIGIPKERSLQEKYPNIKSYIGNQYETNGSPQHSKGKPQEITWLLRAHSSRIVCHSNPKAKR